jgi:hypothetical protein
LAFSGSCWWLNLRDARHVTLLIAGVPYEAVPTVIELIDTPESRPAQGRARPREDCGDRATGAEALLGEHAL